MSICVYTNCREHTCVVTVVYTRVDTMYDVHLYMQVLDGLAGSHTLCVLQGIRIFTGMYCTVLFINYA